MRVTCPFLWIQPIKELERRVVVTQQIYQVQSVVVIVVESLCVTQKHLVHRHRVWVRPAHVTGHHHHNIGWVGGTFPLENPGSLISSPLIIL